jgi:peptide deformylase
MEPPGYAEILPANSAGINRLKTNFMALLPILRYPDPRLHTVAKPVEVVDAGIRRLVADMAETMYAAPGIGLAATQVDVHRRVLVIDITEDKSKLQAFINPEILWREGECVGEEGCLSVPGIYETVRRSERVKVRALDTEGKPFELQADGLLAVCLQHEIDHLDGKVFVEYLSRLKLARIKSKLAKQARITA